jgi:hypothetical protein
MTGHRETYGSLHSQYTSSVIDVITPLQSFADKASRMQASPDALKYIL